MLLRSVSLGYESVVAEGFVWALGMILAFLSLVLFYLEIFSTGFTRITNRWSPPMKQGVPSGFF